MLTRDEEKAIRLQFWIEFDKYSLKLKKRQRLSYGWIMNNTGIKQVKLKFDFTNSIASVGIDVQTRNLDKRIDIFGKLERLKSIFEKKLGQPLIWELDHLLPTGISISRISLELKNVSIYRKEDWPLIFEFYYKKMVVFEELFLEYKDYLKYEAIG